MVRLYVYYDEKYPTHWVSREVSEIITDYLSKYEFEVINAKELSVVMKDSLNYNTPEVVIVFSQDVMPETVLDNPTSPTANSLIRQFLNYGHSIIWIGDVPLFHVGFENGEVRTLGNVPQQNVLGLKGAQMLSTSRIARPTHLGYLFGLPSWSGQRPTPSSTITTPPYIIPLAINLSDSVNPHGFIARYQELIHYAGFIRIYDFVIDSLKKINKQLLRGLLNVALRNQLILIEKIKKHFENLFEAKFNLLKSEIENLSPKLDKILEFIKSKSKPSSIQKVEEQVFYDDFERFEGWEQYGQGVVEQSSDVAYKGRYSLKKDKFGDPNGGYKKLPRKINRKEIECIIFSGWIYRQSNRMGGIADRLAIEDENFNGYGFCAVHSGRLSIEKRINAFPKMLKETEWKPIENDWYKFELIIRKDKLSLYVYDREGNKISEIDNVKDNEYNIFDRVVIHGGFVYYVDCLEVRIIRKINNC